MAELEPWDFQPTLRKIALRLQRRQASRLRQGRALGGGGLEALDPDTVRQKGGSQIGVATGDLLRALSNPANVRVTKTGAVVSIPPALARRWLLLNQGTSRQPARPIGGMTRRDVREAAKDVARALRDEFVRTMQRGLGGR